MTAPTPMQLEVLRVIRNHVADRGYPPTVREIGEELRLTSPSTVLAHLRGLERAGCITRDPAKPRAILVENEEPDTRPRWVDIARAIALANDLPDPSDEAIEWVLWERTPYPVGGFDDVIRGLVRFYASEEARRA